ncbi:MAG TPA: hypothetical protein VMT18_08205 [Planctomycetota bacterium]|nr:hypothetical protein [Planctomycetota bacterium]
MSEATPAERASTSLCALLAVLTVGGLYLWRRGTGFVVQDEGYLWYGVQGVLRGELPLRDFNSYDPAPYVWCAGFARLFGDDLDTLRLAARAFAALGVVAGLRVLGRATRSVALLAVGALALALWIEPHWKSFGPALSLIAVWAGMRLFERDDRAAHVAAGAVAGLAACFGRNYGLYAALGLGLVVLVAGLRRAPRELPRRLAIYSGGVLLGYAPMLLAVAFVPGFARAFVESIGYFASQGHLEGKRAIPFPWRLDPEGWDTPAVLHNHGVGWTYVALPLLVLAGLVLVARTPRERLAERAAPLAAACVGLFWVHHALVHAAYYHLAQAVHPLLLLAGTLGLAAPPPRRRVAVGLGVGALALSAGVTVVPGLEVLHLARVQDTPAAMVEFEVEDDEVWLRPEQAWYLTTLVETLERRVPADEPLFLAPTFPGLYCLLGRRAPTWDVYLAWRATPTSQARLVEELAHVRWAMVTNAAPMGQEWLRLSNTNPEAWAVLLRDFERVDEPGELPRGHRLLRRRDAH